MREIFLLTFLGITVCGSAQTVDLHQAPDITNMPVRVPSTLPTTVVSAATTSIIYKAENSITLSPEPQSGQPDNYTITASGSNYVLAMIDPAIYADMKDKLDASFVLARNFLKFKYEERYVTGQNLDFKIYNYKREVVPISTVIQVPKLGANYFELDLLRFSSIIIQPQDERNYYILEVKNSKGELKLLRFKFI